MTANRRHRNIESRPSGLWDRDTLAWYLGSIDRRALADRRVVVRLSEQDPEIQAWERTSRERRAA